MKQRFGSLYKDVDVERNGWWQLLYVSLHCGRRVVTIFVAVLLTRVFFLQVWIVICLTLIQLIWLELAWPMESKSNN